MEFTDVVKHRRMVRHYDTSRAVPADVVQEVVRTMLRAPSAGFSQGTGFLVLTTPQEVATFRASVTPDEGAENWFAAQVDAPVLIVVLANKDVYLDRYAQADKGFTDRSDAWWSAPYWDIDAGMAALMGLLSCVDQGLGACFFGMEIGRIENFQQTFAIPLDFRPIGIVSLGYTSEPPRDLRAHRKPESSLVHYGRWSHD